MFLRPRKVLHSRSERALRYDAQIKFDAVFSRMDPEKAHERGFSAIRAGRLVTKAALPKTQAPRTVMGVEFPHAFGLAAGFDKNARVFARMPGLGFTG